MQKMATPRSRTKRWLVRFPRGVPVAIFVLIAAITALSVYAIERGENQRAEAQLHNQADAVASALERRSNASSAYLRAGAALLATLDDVPPPLFRRFVSELRLDADYRGAEGIGWAKIVPPRQVASVNAQLAAQAPGRVMMHPPLDPAQPYAVPVIFLQPDTERNRRALGFEKIGDGFAETAVWDEVRAPGDHRLIAARDLVLALRSGLHL